MFLCVALWAAPVRAVDISGTPAVIDGDTLKIGTQVIRLYGVDAPENGQSCTRGNGRSYQCGVEAESVLKDLVGTLISCTGSEFDRYSRLIAVCTSSGTDVNRELVRRGYALAFRKFSTKYVTDETFAASAALGIWGGAFEKPWDFRAGKWSSAVRDASVPGCPIKGNINRKGERIYHTPWSRSYQRTRIDTNRSERWFCSEAEALAAGWRAPYR